MRRSGMPTRNKARQRRSIGSARRSLVGMDFSPVLVLWMRGCVPSVVPGLAAGRTGHDAPAGRVGRRAGGCRRRLYGFRRDAMRAVDDGTGISQRCRWTPGVVTRKDEVKILRGLKASAGVKRFSR